MYFILFMQKKDRIFEIKKIIMEKLGKLLIYTIVFPFGFIYGFYKGIRGF